MRFFRKKNQPGGGPPGGSPFDREIPRPPLEPLPPIPARRGDAGGRLFLRVRRGAPQCAFIKDPAPARVRKTHFPFFRMQNPQGSAGRRSPGREIPHAHKTRSPRPPKHRTRGGRAGVRRSDGRRGMRSSGCDRPRLRMHMRMRGTRHARYLQTLPQPYSYAAYLTQIFSTADISLRRYIPTQNMPMQILRRT